MCDQMIATPPLRSFNPQPRIADLRLAMQGEFSNRTWRAEQTLQALFGFLQSGEDCTQEKFDFAFGKPGEND